MNEMLKNFIEPGLERQPCHVQPLLGSKVPSDPKHVVYVWIDALINYITALGYGQDEHGGNFDLFWQNDENHEIIHMIGKDILRFHSIYCGNHRPPALDLPLPTLKNLTSFVSVNTKTAW